MITAGEHVSVFGITGSGKSTLTRKIAALFSRRIIFDRLNEWPSENIATDYESFIELYRVAHPLSDFTIVIKPLAGTSHEALIELTDRVLSVVYQVEKYECKGIALIFEEVWLYAPLHQIPKWFLELLLTGRHAKISIIGNSQRPATVSKTMVSQSKHVFVGQYFEARDRDYYASCLGSRPELDTPPQKYNFYWFRADHAGEKPQLISS